MEVLEANMDKKKLEAVIQSKQLQSTRKAMAVAKNDCRVFERLLTLHSLWECPKFLNEKNLNVRVDTLYRLCNIGKMYEYCPVWKNDLQPLSFAWMLNKKWKVQGFFEKRLAWKVLFNLQNPTEDYCNELKPCPK